MTTEPAIGCPMCLREVRTSTHPENDHHYSVEWPPCGMLNVFKGDEHISEVTELITGPGGWAIRLVIPARLCDCSFEDCARYRDVSDDWRVEGPPEALATPARLLVDA
jgi:hypothetical protein